MARFNFNDIDLGDKADITKIAQNFYKIEELGALLTDVSGALANSRAYTDSAISNCLKFIDVAPADLNNATNFGMYRVGVGSVTNLPKTGPIYGILLVYESRGREWEPQVSNSWIWQELRTKNEIYIRNASTANSWSEWQIKPVEEILFENNNGSGGSSIHLFKSSNNYRGFKILYNYQSNNNGLSSVEVYRRGSESSVRANLNSIHCDGQNLQLYYSQGYIDNDLLLISNETQKGKNINISNNSITNINSPVLLIYKVIGII